MWQEIKNLYHGVSAYVAAPFYGFPGKKLRVIGVTGTDGKTTTVHLIYHILRSEGKRVSLVSSVYAEIGGSTFDTGFHVTSPNEWLLQKLLKQAVDRHEEYVILEVTSHALDQHRVDWIDFEIGVLTNVTHEHLDYHGTYLNYVKTKERLLERAKKAMVNLDDQSYRYLHRDSLRSCITYGLTDQSDVNPINFSFTSPLPGEYNTYNCLAAIAVCKELGIQNQKIRKTLKTFEGVKGRFEKFPTNKNFDVIIDFAHTPNALNKVLSTLKPMVKGKLIHVFGSAARRDRLKRPIMGEESAKFCDIIILTEEDYRDEDVNKIITEIARGCVKQGAQELNPDEVSKARSTTKPVFLRIPDRKEAIFFAIRKLAQKGDTVLLTGKAHEKSLARGREEVSWSEHETVKDALANV